MRRRRASRSADPHRPPDSLRYFTVEDWLPLVDEADAAPYLALGASQPHARRQAAFTAWRGARRAWRDEHGWPGGRDGEMQGSLRESTRVFCPDAVNEFDRPGVW